MPGRWCPMAPKAPTKRKISWALQRACAAVKIGISNKGVPTNRTRSRQRSRIHGDGAAPPEETGADGLAGQVSTALEARGFIVADRGDADHYGYTRTVIHYGGGQRAKAQLLQRQLEGGAVLEEDPTLRVVDVVLIVGADYAGVRSAPATNPTPVTTVPAPEPPVPIPKGAPPAQSC